MTYTLLYVLALLPVALAQIGGIDGPIITISSGQVQGELVATHYEGISVHSVMGIPFAAPPLGDLRFEVSNALCCLLILVLSQNKFV